MNNLYILSIWKNHNSPKEWLYDVAPIEQYFKNSFTYLTEYKKPYYYTPIYTGSQEICSKIINELQTLIKDIENSEELETSLKKYFERLI